VLAWQLGYFAHDDGVCSIPQKVLVQRTAWAKGTLKWWTDLLRLLGLVATKRHYNPHKGHHDKLTYILNLGRVVTAEEVRSAIAILRSGKGEPNRKNRDSAQESQIAKTGVAGSQLAVLSYEDPMKDSVARPRQGGGEPPSVPPPASAERARGTPLEPHHDTGGTNSTDSARASTTTNQEHDAASQRAAAAEDFEKNPARSKPAERSERERPEAQRKADVTKPDPKDEEEDEDEELRAGRREADARRERLAAERRRRERSLAPSHAPDSEARRQRHEIEKLAVRAGCLVRFDLQSVVVHPVNPAGMVETMSALQAVGFLRRRSLDRRRRKK
jgi:hypothetical protein